MRTDAREGFGDVGRDDRVAGGVDERAVVSRPHEGAAPVEEQRALARRHAPTVARRAASDARGRATRS